MRHADLLREATAVIATPASAPCMILQCGTWYGCVAVWPCGCVFGGGMNDAIGSKNKCKNFSTEIFDCRIQSKKSSFSIGSASRNSPSKKVGSKKPFFDCVRKLDLGFSRKSPFSTDKSDRVRKLDLHFSRKRPFSTGKSECIRNGLNCLLQNLFSADSMLDFFFCNCIFLFCLWKLIFLRILLL